MKDSKISSKTWNDIFPEQRYPCPCCGFYTLLYTLGGYDICKICWWEDDGVQLQYPKLSIGANNMSLFDYQAKLDIPDEVTELSGIPRDYRWRRLREEDCRPLVNEINDGYDYFLMIGEEDARCYWKESYYSDIFKGDNRI